MWEERPTRVLPLSSMLSISAGHVICTSKHGIAAPDLCRLEFSIRVVDYLIFHVCGMFSAAEYLGVGENFAYATRADYAGYEQGGMIYEPLRARRSLDRRHGMPLSATR